MRIFLSLLLSIFLLAACSNGGNNDSSGKKNEIEGQNPNPEKPIKPTPAKQPTPEPTPEPEPQPAVEDVDAKVELRGMLTPALTCSGSSEGIASQVQFVILFHNKVITKPVVYQLTLSDKSGQPIPNVEFEVAGFPVENGVVDLSSARGGGAAGVAYIRRAEFCKMQPRPEHSSDFSISLVRVQK